LFHDADLYLMSKNPNYFPKNKKTGALAGAIPSFSYLYVKDYGYETF